MHGKSMDFAGWRGFLRVSSVLTSKITQKTSKITQMTSEITQMTSRASKPGGVRDLNRHQPGEPGPWGGVGEGFPLPRIGDWRDIYTCVRSTRQRPKGLGGFACDRK